MQRIVDFGQVSPLIGLERTGTVLASPVNVFGRVFDFVNGHDMGKDTTYRGINF